MKKFNNKLERREFLDRSTKLIGASGLGVLLASLAPHDPVFAKLNNLQIEKHSDDFMEGLRVLSRSKKTTQNNDSAFLQTINNFDELLKSGDKSAVRLYEELRIKKNSLIKSEQFGVYENNSVFLDLPEKLSNSMVGAFLSATNYLDLGPVGIPEMRRALTKNITLEPGFIEAYTTKINSEILYNYEFSEFIEQGSKRLNELLGHYKTSLSSQKNENIKKMSIAKLFGINDAEAQTQTKVLEYLIVAGIVITVIFFIGKLQQQQKQQ